MNDIPNSTVVFCHNGCLQKQFLSNLSIGHFIKGFKKRRMNFFLLMMLLFLGLSMAPSVSAYDQGLVDNLETEVKALEEIIQKLEIPKKPEEHTDAKFKKVEAIEKEKKRLLEKTEAFFEILKKAVNDTAIKQSIPGMNEIVGAIITIGDNIVPVEGKPNLNAYNRRTGQIQASVRALFDDAWESSFDTTRLIYVLIGSLLLILFLTGVAFWSRSRIFNEAEDKDKIAEFAMKQTFGLPVGTVRGIMALLISLLFIISLFWGADVMKDIPEVVKIIVSLVFGFYFAKSTDQSKDLMDAMLGKSKQQSVKRKEAALAVEDARKAEAESLAPELFMEAQNEFGAGDQLVNASEAISKFNSAIKKAQEAKDAATKKNRDKFNELADETEKRIIDLAELKIDYRAVKEIYATSKAQYERGNFQDAAKTLERVKSMVDILLEEYDEAKKIYEEKLSEEQRQKLEEARKNIEEAKSLGVGGGDLISGIISTMGVLKEKGEHLIPLFKKRIEGKDFEASDVIDIFKHLKLSDDEKKLANIVDIAINSIGANVAAPLRDLLKGDLLDQVITGDDNQLRNIFSTDIVKSGIQETVFTDVVKKMRKNLVDVLIGDDVKKGLADNLSFDAFKKAMKNTQEDTDGKGVLNSVEKVLEIGETILSFTPYGGIAKIAGALGRGIFTIFGK